MAKRSGTVTVTTVCCGLFAKWSNRCSELPRFLKFTSEIPARIESEFGFILKISGAKGKSVEYTVIHPPFRDENGRVEPPFTGSIPIRANPFEIYLGDTLWEPIHDKIGTWRFIAKIDGKTVEDKSFTIVDQPELHAQLIDQFAHEHI